MLISTTALLLLAGPVLPPHVTPAQTAGLRQTCAPVLALDEARLRALLPTQGGLYFVGCPNCTGGRQEGQLTWSLQDPEVAVCQYCGHRYPSAKYPMDHADERVSPGGAKIRYPYWTNDKGYRYYFAARLDDLKKHYFEDLSWALAKLWLVSHDEAAGRRAAIIIDHFATVYPNFCFHYDYPFQQKVIEDGVVPPAKLRPGFRTARWSWWAYMDIPFRLVQAHDLLRDSGLYEKLSAERGYDVRQRIEQDFFRVACEQTLANPEPFTNMSPPMWSYLMAAGRVLREPRYVHTPVQRLRQFMTGYYYDGAWQEGAPSYHSQTIGSLDELADLAHGYSDPPGYQPPAGEARLSDLDLFRDVPELGLARATLAQMRLPNGRYVPVHDTWSTNGRQALDHSDSYLLGALGHACLGRGERGAQQQTHLTWSGAFGHAHGDGLSLLLWSLGHELLSDLGYTHSAYRAWTITSLAHNLVLLDGQPQRPSGGVKTEGTLRWFTGGPTIQAVSADNPTCCDPPAKLYRRTVVQVPIDAERAYLVDRFEVDGGRIRDYLLWGSADDEQRATFEPALTQPVPSLLPAGVSFTAPTNEGDMTVVHGRPWLAYGFLSHITAGAAAPLHRVLFQHGDLGTATTVFGQPGDVLHSVAAANVRGANENDTELLKHLRTGLLWRRTGAAKDFVAVIEPFRGRPTATVAAAQLTGCAAAFTISLPAERQDLILLGAEAARGEFAGGPVTATGEVVVITAVRGRVERLWVAGPGAVSAGGLTATAPAPTPGRLVAYEPQALVVESGPEPQPGQIVMVRHGDGAVSPYTCLKVEPAAQGRRVVVRENAGFRLTAAGVAQALGHPAVDHPAPHLVTVASVAEAARN